MQFKIDAKDLYTVIKPQKGILDTQLAADLAEQCLLQTETGSKNFIIDLESCQDVRPDFLLPFIDLSAHCYEKGQSFVMTHAPAGMLGLLKEADAVDSLNCAPTLIEAIDIISMEILERDLFGEE